MPKKHNQVKEKKIKSLLTPQQINKVDDVGDYIDEQIELKPDSNYVHIEGCIMRFECEPITHNPLSYPEPERALMQDLLMVRFNDADWRIDYIDGFWILFMRDF